MEGKKRRQDAWLLAAKERFNLGFIGQKNINMAVQKAHEVGVMTLDAKPIGQRKPNFATLGAHALGGDDKGLARTVAVPNIAFGEKQSGLCQYRLVQIFRRGGDGGAQNRVHSAFRIGGHQYQAMAGGQAGLGAAGKSHIEGFKRAAKNLPQSIVRNFADKSGCQPEACDARNAIGGRAARLMGMHGDRFLHGFRLLGFDERHGGLGAIERV